MLGLWTYHYRELRLSIDHNWPSILEPSTHHNASREVTLRHCYDTKDNVQELIRGKIIVQVVGDL